MNELESVATMRWWTLCTFGCLFACHKTEDGATRPAPMPAPATAAAPAPAPAPAPAEAAAASAAPRASNVAEPSWSELLGRCVSLEGTTEGGAKTGPKLHAGAFTIGVVLDAGVTKKWNALAPGTRVRVRGVVAERADLPVFVQKPGELPMQGIPVPEGTDLDAARRRYVIEKVQLSPLRTASEVTAALTAATGRDVSLAGNVWSVNGHYWFNHDGVTLHVEGQDRFPEWTSLHGKAVTLDGRLERRPMPRIDQLVLKPKPDLAEAFVLVLSRVTPASGSPIAVCEP